MDLRCPHCRNAFELIEPSLQKEIFCPDCASAVSLSEVLSIDVSMTAPAPSKETASLKGGDTVGHFEIEELLGKGGFGSVYSAFDSRLERRVALKIPRMNKLSVWHVDSFIREAQAAAQLRHPNIVGVYEVGREEDRVYIVSELVEGVTLSQWQKEHQPDYKICAKMIAEVARAIHIAHEKGVIHRDLKPGNIIVDDEGKPQITDFGLAKRVNPEEITITVKGQVVGTPAYMTPEQAQGKSDLADGRTDVYSLGVVLYELLAGRRPFIGTTALLIDEVIEGQIPEIRDFEKDVPKDLEAICLKAMATKPGDRFATSLEFAEDLERFANDQPTLTRPLTRVQKFARRAKQNWISILAASIIVSLIGTSLYFAFLGRSPVAPDNTLLVEFKVDPPRADVSIVKVDLELGQVDYENILVPDSSDEGYLIRLNPGWYIIEAYFPGHGIQEVWRYVPRDESDPSLSEDLSSMNWTFQAEAHVRLAPLRIFENTTRKDKIMVGPESLVMLKGGEFESGSQGLWNQNGTPRIPKKTVQISDFYLGESEVSFERYDAVMKIRGYLMSSNYDDHGIPASAPVTNVSFYEALEYCERLGLRLPVFDEYLYAATNGGTTAFPWGDDKRTLDAWKSRTVFEPEFDKTQNANPISNLFSSVLEWTQDVDLVVNMKTGQALRSQLPNSDRTSNARIVVGGPGECLRGRTPHEASYIGPRFFVDVVPTKTDLSGLGFRCARSTKRRLVQKTNSNGD